jgi:hypothetical protein
MEKELPQTSAQLFHYNKRRIVITILLAYVLIAVFNVTLKPNFVIDFIFLALLHIADSITTRFGLEYIPGIHEVNPDARKNFKKIGYTKTLLKGLGFVLFLVLVLYVLNLSIAKFIKPNPIIKGDNLYSLYILALYLLFTPQPFLNLIVIRKAINKKK